MEHNRLSKGAIVAIIVVLALAGVAVYALSQTKPAPGPVDPAEPQATESSNQTANDEAAPAPSERMTITFRENGFDPETITVKRGTLVTLKNESSRDFQFSSDDHPTHQDNDEMNLQTIGPGESASYTATDVGSWGYHDHNDENKTGTVIVTE